MSEPKAVAAKLRIQAGTPVWISDRALLAVLGPMPDGVSVVDTPGASRVAVLVAEDGASVRAGLAVHAAALGAVDAFWVAYPKGNRTDVNRDSLWPILAEHGFRPISQIAVDATWSALRFRLQRPGEAPFLGG